ncbi:unnamed protein product [Adineta ricciae]|uniref:peptidylglycine monooxygenase n=1 Tax=Adineta ricciae TaxID=249248 RepID=A0A816END0_ADIRI|nr:unnamed protein product [Adineta ricciae]
MNMPITSHFNLRGTTSWNLLIILITVLNIADSITIPNDDDIITINVTMSNVTTTKEDQYAYVQYLLPDEELTIIGYLPLINMNIVHHMVTYACSIPASNRSFWFDGLACIGKQLIVHVWALNGQPLILPKDVGFVVGRNTPYKFIIVNLHYLSIVTDDNSGNQLLVSRKSRPYRAGIMLSGTHHFHLPPKTHKIQATFSCCYRGSRINIFAVKLHTHRWGRMNSLYQIRGENITQIIRGSPQRPQSFYALPSQVSIDNGDYLVGECVYDNDDDHAVNAGPSHDDEMCNIYAMYSYKFEQILNDSTTRTQRRTTACWGNTAAHMTRLLFDDNVTITTVPYVIQKISQINKIHAEQTIQLSMSHSYTNPQNTSDAAQSEKFSMNETKLPWLLIISCIIFLSTLIIWTLYRILCNGIISNDWIQRQKNYEMLMPDGAEE